MLGSESRSHPSRGFSLIELLVVISLIVMIVALLLPSLQKVRQRAMDMGCSSNLRQLTMAMSLYATQFRDYFPPMEIVIAGLTTFPDRLDDTGVLNAVKATDKQSIFFCPDYDRSTYSSQYSRFKVTYAVHDSVVGYRREWGWVIPAKRRSRLLQPSSVVLMGDGVYQVADQVYSHQVYLNFNEGYEIGKYHHVPTRYVEGAWIRYAHREHPQAGLVDGHVEQRRGPWSSLVRP